MTDKLELAQRGTPDGANNIDSGVSTPASCKLLCPEGRGGDLDANDA